MGGSGLERFKFLLYLVAPVGAVYLFSMPAVHENFMTMRRYVVYAPTERAGEEYLDVKRAVEARRRAGREGGDGTQLK